MIRNDDLVTFIKRHRSNDCVDSVRRVVDKCQIVSRCSDQFGQHVANMIELRFELSFRGQKAYRISFQGVLQSPLCLEHDARSSSKRTVI